MSSVSGTSCHRTIDWTAIVRIPLFAKGEFFRLSRWPALGPQIEVLDVQPAERHLLLLVRESGDAGESPSQCTEAA